MQCVICKHGVTKRGLTTVTLNRGETTLVFKNVPAEVCNTCGEYYLDDATAASIQRRSIEAEKNGAEVEILRFAV